MILADLHVHSDNSPDAKHSLIELCENAVQKNLTFIAITDHCEVDVFYKDRYDIVVTQSFFDVLKARYAFTGQLEVLSGIELGNALDDRALAEKIVKQYPYDIVLGSQHHISGYDDFAFLDYNHLDIQKTLDQYFYEIEQLVDWGQFDSLAHLTYPLRYINGIFKKEIDIRIFKDKIERVFQKLIAKNIGLEINTSGLRQPYGVTMPDLYCLELYKKAGGKIITIGSDSHCYEDIGANIKDGIEVARSAGFNQYCIFKHRKPEFFTLE